MKKNAIGHMHPPKRGFGEFLKKLHIIPFLLCLILAVILWLVVANVPKEADTAKTAVETAQTETTTAE